MAQKLEDWLNTEVEELSKFLESLSVPIGSLENNVIEAKDNCQNYKIK